MDDPIEKYYNNYNSSHKFLEMQVWYDFTEIHRWATSLFSIPYNNSPLRDNIRQSYVMIFPLYKPFSATKRFPSGFLVRMGSSDISNTIYAILTAIDLPNNGIDVDTSESKRTFNVKVLDLLRMLNNANLKELAKSGVYTRETFEEEFGLNWFQ